MDVFSQKMSTLWGVIMRGLETIRLVMPNALSLPLVVHIAKILDARVRFSGLPLTFKLMKFDQFFWQKWKNLFAILQGFYACGNTGEWQEYPGL